MSLRNPLEKKVPHFNFYLCGLMGVFGVAKAKLPTFLWWWRKGRKTINATVLRADLVRSRKTHLSAYLISGTQFGCVRW